jgi:hypothetical protein
LQIFFSYYETQQLILGTGTAIWWLTEPHYADYFHNVVRLSLERILKSEKDDG